MKREYEPEVEATPIDLARALKRTADESQPGQFAFRAAMMQLARFQNRAARSLSPGRVQAIQKARIQLRKLYAREEE